VIAEFKTIVEPHPESFDSVVHFPELVELVFIDESNHRDFLIAERAQQLRRHLEISDRATASTICKHTYSKHNINGVPFRLN
jgi:hypothetical protein